MKGKHAIVVLAVVVLLSGTVNGWAREERGQTPVAVHMATPGPVSDTEMNPQFRVPAQADTTFLALFTFDSGSQLRERGLDYRRSHGTAARVLARG